jgi:hypothetical protein
MLETPVFLGKAQMALVVKRRHVLVCAALQVVVVGRALALLFAKAQSELSGPVAQGRSHQHEPQMSNKYEFLY